MEFKHESTPNTLTVLRCANCVPFPDFDLGGDRTPGFPKGHSYRTESLFVLCVETETGEGCLARRLA
jgi:hypothetical protein